MQMNDVQVFKYNSNEVRMVQMDGEPWWVLKDVCSILEMDTSQVGKVENIYCKRIWSLPCYPSQ